MGNIAEPPPASVDFVSDGALSDEERFTAFVAATEPRLRRSLAGFMTPDSLSDAVAEAYAWGWAHRDRLEAMDHPVGYLYRVARSSVRERAPTRVRWLINDLPRVPEVEPGLVGALLALPERQRTAVWLVHACDWTHGEVAEAMEISTSAVSTHVARGLGKLRNEIGTNHD